MHPKPKICGARDGVEVPLPQDLDAFVITTGIGSIYIDLAGQVKDMVLIRPSMSDPRLRLLLSPMDSGRLALGVIKA